MDNIRASLRLLIVTVLVLGIWASTPRANNVPPSPSNSFYGDATGDSIIDSADLSQMSAWIMGLPYAYDTIQPQTATQDWNTSDVTSDILIDAGDLSVLSSWILGFTVSIPDKPWVLSSENLPASLEVNTPTTFQINLASTLTGIWGRAGIPVIANIDAANSTATGSLAGRTCSPVVGSRDQAASSGDQCALSVTVTDWYGAAGPTKGLTETATYGLSVTGTTPGNLRIIFSISGYPPGLDIPAVTLGVTVTINSAPVWNTMPSDISLNNNSTYNQVNGYASDPDTGQTLTCSLTSNTCSFAVTVGGTGPNTGASCNINFTSGATAENCNITIQVSDGAGGNVTANVNVVTCQRPAITAGAMHTCALTATGGAKCWGNNNKGQLGDGTSGNNRFTPVDVTGLTSGVAMISSGEDHSCAITVAGGAKCWGNNWFGQLGDNRVCGSQECPTPRDVVGLSSGVMAISAGVIHTCALTTTGGMKCWGRNSNGQLGDNTITDRWAPVNVTGLSSGVAAISSGVSYTCALTTSGGAKCWGYNGSGQLGDNTNIEHHTPVDVYGLASGVTMISAGFNHTCALTILGGVKCWGYNGYGQLGDNSTTNRWAPVNVTGLTSSVVAISAGGYHTCALTTSGGVKCWGRNNHGQLGDNTITNRWTPVNVIGLTSGVKIITAGGGPAGDGDHSCAITMTDVFKCWGLNGSGQIGDNSTTDRWTPVDVVW